MQEHHILPFIGAAFEGQRPQLVRALVVGINTYISAKDWEPEQGRPAPGWFPTWIQTARDRFGKRLRAESLELLSALTGNDGPLAGKVLEWPASYYVTNAIKVHLREEQGKRAHQISDGMFESHAGVWQDELDLMAAFAVLPDVIMIFGWAFWARACASFRPPRADTFRTLRILNYEHFAGQWQRSLRRLRFGGASGDQDALLVRLRHPSARTNVGSARWLLAQGDLSLLSPGSSEVGDDRPSDAEVANYREGDGFIYRGHRYTIFKGACRRVFPPPPE